MAQTIGIFIPPYRKTQINDLKVRNIFGAATWKRKQNVFAEDWDINTIT